MLKVFSRGHKVQINNNNGRGSNSTIENGGASSTLGLSYDHMRRRNSSIRASAITFNETGMLDSVSSIGGRSVNLVPKKYVSCDNFSKNNDFEDDYQEVIDEDYDEENGIKDKLVKRYNSLTNLLMRSFRKAKIKKKKEAMLQESMINEVDSSASLNRQSQSVETSMVRTPRLKNKRESMHQQEEIAEENSDDNLNENAQSSSSKPVYKGSRLISSEFNCDLNNKTNSLKLKSNNDILNNINTSLLCLNGGSNMHPNTSKNFNSLRLHENKKIDCFQLNTNSNNNNNNNQKTCIYSTVSNRTKKKIESINGIYSQNSNEKEIRPKVKKNENENRLKEENSKIDVLQKFSSHKKPQAPKPPVAVISNNNKNNNNDKSKLEDESLKEASASKKSMIVKRSKTFTQQLQEILKDHKINKQDTPSNQMNENQQTNSNYSYSSNLPKQQQENISRTPSSMIEEKESIPNNTATISQTLSHMTKSLILDSNDNKKNDISQDYLDYSFTIANDPIKSINDFNRIQIETNNLDIDLENYEETSAEQPKSNASCDKDEFKDLIQVLAGQEPEFKNKFFNCLMTKLWDTSLPMEEYVQLNKLLTALFGENYHKMNFHEDSSRTIKNAHKIDYLNLKSTKNSKLDAEYIVNLMKVYLDAKSNNSSGKTNKESVENSRENMLNKDTSITNLINSLRVRQQRDESSTDLSRIMPRSANNFSLINSDTYDLEDKIQQFKSEFSFRNGFNGLANKNESASQQSKAKSSLVLKLDDDLINNENFINHSLIDSSYPPKKRSIILDQTQQHKKSIESLFDDENDSLTGTYQFTRDSKARKTLMNYERSFITATLAKNSNNNKNNNNSDELTKSDESKSSSVKNENNKITKFIRVNRLDMSSPISYCNKSTTNSINESLINTTNNKLSLSNISDISSTKQPIEIHHQKNIVKSHVTSFQPQYQQEMQYPKTYKKINNNENYQNTKPAYNIVRTVVQPPKPKLAATVAKPPSSPNQEIIIKQKNFKVVNIFKNVNENILNIKHSPHMANSSPMRKRDGECSANIIEQYQQMNKQQQQQQKPEAIYQVQRISKKFDPDSSNAVFNPNETRSPRTTAAATSHTYVYHEHREHEQKNMKNFNEESYHKHFMKKKCYEYTYEPVKKIASHQLKDLMTEKIYKLERKEMLQAFY